MSAVRGHWLTLFSLLESSRRPGTPATTKVRPYAHSTTVFALLWNHSGLESGLEIIVVECGLFCSSVDADLAPQTLAKGDMQQALIKACEQGLLGSITSDQVAGFIATIDVGMIADSGEVKYEDWIKRYAGDFFSVHRAFQGRDESTGMPKWDTVIACFEALDNAKGPSSQSAMRHEVGLSSLACTLSLPGFCVRAVASGVREFHPSRPRPHDMDPLRSPWLAACQSHPITRFVRAHGALL